MGIPIVAEYEDAGISGGLLTSRFGMMAAIDTIIDGDADTLICATLDRFSRDVEHQHKIKRRVEMAGGRIVLCDMTIEDTAEGKLNFSIQGSFKQYEKDAIRTRTMRGKRARAEQGQQPQRSRPPYGYHIVTNAEVETQRYAASERGHYIIVEERAAIVRRIFSEYVDGRSSLPKICKDLNREGVPMPANGRLWQHATVRLIITNPVYKGEPMSGKQKCHVDESLIGLPHRLTGLPRKKGEVRRVQAMEDRIKLSAPELVSREVWDAAQIRLVENSKNLRGNPKRIQMLTGRTVCPYCGDRAVVKNQVANGKKYRYLICGQRRKAATMTDAKPCSSDLYPIDIIEQATIRVVQEAWMNPEALSRAEIVYMGDAPVKLIGESETKRELAALTKALAELKVEETAAVQGQIAGIRAGASPDAYRDIFAEIAARRKDLEDRHGRLSVAQGSITRDQTNNAKQRAQSAVQQALKDAYTALADPEVPGMSKRDILLTIVDKVICHKDGAEVVFHPGLFDEDAQTTSNLNCYTTCIGIKTQR